MKEIAKVVGINLVVLLLVTVLIYAYFSFSTPARGDVYRVLLLSLFVMILQVVVSLILSIVYFYKKKPEYGTAFIVSMMVVPLLGYSFCSIGFSIFE